MPVNASASDGGVRRPRPTTEPLPARDHLQRLSQVWIKHPIYFISCCAYERRRVLATPRVAAILVGALHDSRRVSGWVVGKYAIMPDHVHFFATPLPGAKTLSQWMRDWKRWTAREIAKTGAVGLPLWQPEFFDHVLRSANSYSEKWEYVRKNPVRAGLVSEPEHWPFAGECESLAF